MATTGKFTTIQDIIERTHRSGFNDFTEEEAKEWAWECISLIGNPAHYVDKVAVLPVENARAELPYDLYDTTESGIRDYYTKLPLIKETDIYYNSENVGENIKPLNFETTGASVVYVDGVPQENTDAFLSLISYEDYKTEYRTYKINNGFIYTGFKTGVIELAYKSFPIDNDGAPLIEDNFKVIRALVSYIKRMVAERMWMRDEIIDKKFEVIKQQAMFHMSSAKSETAIQ